MHRDAQRGATTGILPTPGHSRIDLAHDHGTLSMIGVRMRILAVGTVTFDVIGWTDSTFHEDSLTVPLTSLALTNGGRGANFAAVVSAMGREVRLVSSVGTDFAASTYRAELASRGIDMSGLFCRDDNPVTPRVFLFNNDNGARVYQYRDRRPEAEAGFSAWVALQAASWPHDLVYCTSEVPEANEAALRSSPATKIFAPGHDLRSYPRDCLMECLARTDILIVNAEEWKFLANGENLPERTADDIEVIVVTLGSSGCTVHRPTGAERIPACPPTEMVDPTGAGDAFAGGFAHQILHDQDPVQAARVGSVVASFVIESAGCQSGIPTSAQVTRRSETVYPAAT